MHLQGLADEAVAIGRRYVLWECGNATNGTGYAPAGVYLTKEECKIENILAADCRVRRALWDELRYLKRLETTVLARMRSELLTAISPSTLAQGQSGPDKLPLELIEKAKVLLDRGNVEDKILAKITLKQHDEANRIIQELKAKSGNPIDEAFLLLSLEGDNWYQAGQPDKAIEPYEKAMNQRPTDFKARNSLAIARYFARVGNIADHQRRAIEVAEGTLKIVVLGSGGWVMTQNNLGLAWSRVPTGDKVENLARRSPATTRRSRFAQRILTRPVGPGRRTTWATRGETCRLGIKPRTSARRSPATKRHSPFITRPPTRPAGR